ncbi:RNA helicase [Gulosibacter sp. 10]|uniref:DEAD/DEAH box helicase n=1 Tax=Gulosibacter sp. 10 TaxID=1255570 RepID=UPI00097EF8F3|nr:DEAD/DEAH box helicase [Gulosibacter sp. 10]SJM67678.1 putative helicase [Gulosibacter sp. 10]
MSDASPDHSQPPRVPSLAELIPTLADPDAPYDPDHTYEAVLEWTGARGIDLYDAQDEAIIHLVSGSNVVLATPTGTGKSLVAIAAHAIELARGGRTYYTAPIKALVSEKFFALVEVFGAERVGMVTGDSSVNPEASIICCTAEILANKALREGADADVDQVVMDEFHYYGDPQRGAAWQIPLLLLPRAQFLLMSATLGDTDALRADLTRRTGRATELVAGATRPVPLSFRYALTPVHNTVEELLEEDEAPIYIVHFSQAAAVERAQALTSIKVASREHRDRIVAAMGDFRFTTTFGRNLSRWLRQGIGVHHAGMLPRYRRLVEQLAQRGLLKVICGTDTLGVGINVPIRSVLITALSKYDGQRMRHLTAREFHQIAGRAGRAGYDDHGTVVVEAPEHVVEYEHAVTKAAGDPKKQRKITKKQPPKGFVNWTEATFDRIVAAEPEPLTSHLEMTSATLINVVARGGDVIRHLRELCFDNHEPRARRFALARRALEIGRTLLEAGIIVADGQGIRLTVELQSNFALNQPLSPFAIAMFDVLDPESDAYALDAVSVIEATLENPRPVLRAQEHKARGEAIAAMKADGIDYDERMERVEEITWPKPLVELLEQSYEMFASSQPWVRDFELSPKSVVRDMYERGLSFAEYVAFYDLARSEGLVLRYLSDAYRALQHTVPGDARTDQLADLTSWLGELVRQVDSSLIDEWAELVAPVDAAGEPVLPPAPPSVVSNTRAFTVLVRNAMWRRVHLAALERDEELLALDPKIDWPEILDEYYEEYDDIAVDAAARAPEYCRIDKSRMEHGYWDVEQTLVDPAGDHAWRIRAEVDLEESAARGEAVVMVSEVVNL